MNTPTLPDSSAVASSATGLVDTIVETVSDVASVVGDDMSSFASGASMTSLPFVAKGAKFAAKRPRLFLKLGLLGAVAYLLYRQFSSDADSAESKKA